jgi:hypothetical protein
MGLRDWLAGSVAGPQSYGNAMGKQAREAGSALANAVFLSRGNASENGPSTIFDTLSDLESAGLKAADAPPSTLDLASLSPDEVRLLRSLTTAMISYFFIVNSNGALQNMQRENTSRFRSGLGPSLQNAMVSCGLFRSSADAGDALLSYVNSMGTVSQILNRAKPAEGDLLEQFIIRAVQESEQTKRCGFVRTGPTGFDAIAIPLVEETLAAIVSATRQYRW